MKMIKFKLDDDKHDKLAKAAERIQGSVPQIVRLAIDHYIKVIEGAHGNG